MSWVPSPSPRLSASYRDVPLGAMPSVFNPHPSGLSFGMAAVPAVAQPYQGGPQIPQVRQGSFTPAPSAQAAASAQHRGLSPSLAQLPMPTTAMPNRLGNLNNMPYVQPVFPTPAEKAFQNRSWQPPPQPAALVDGFGLQRPATSCFMDDALSRSLTMLPSQGINFASPVPPPRLPGAPELGPGAPEPGVDPRALVSQQKQPSFSQGPVFIRVNVYWHKPLSFVNGRAQKSIGGGELNWMQKMGKDLVGAFHVGIEVHGCEYTFGNTHGFGSQRLGGPASGVCRHDAQCPGPHFEFKEFANLGRTTKTKEQVDEICAMMGNTTWTSCTYNKIRHNCVDFCSALSQQIGGRPVPADYRRAADFAKSGQDMIGYLFGGAPGIAGAEDSADLSTSFDTQAGLPTTTGSIGVPVLDTTLRPQPQPLDQRQLAMDANHGRGTYVAPAPLAMATAPLLAVPATGGTFVAPPPMAGTYVAPPGPPPLSVPSLTRPPDIMPIQGLASANSVLDNPRVLGPPLGAGRLPAQPYAGTGQMPQAYAGAGQMPQGFATAGGTFMPGAGRPFNYQPGLVMPRRDTLGNTWR